MDPLSLITTLGGGVTLGVLITQVVIYILGKKKNEISEKELFVNNYKELFDSLTERVEAVEGELMNERDERIKLVKENIALRQLVAKLQIRIIELEGAAAAKESKAKEK